MQMQPCHILKHLSELNAKFYASNSRFCSGKLGNYLKLCSFPCNPLALSTISKLGCRNYQVEASEYT